MGLDMYAMTAPVEMVGDRQVDMEDLLFSEGSAREGVDRDFDYWRKFNNLHAWMADLYYRKGGKSESFNCNTLRLMPEDLDKLWNEAETLKPQGGFFWGDEDEMTPEAVDNVRSFVTKARSAIAEGKAVIYDSWW